MKSLNKFLLSILVLVVAIISGSFYINTTQASHSWNNYHWATSSTPLKLTVGNNLSSTWSSHVDLAISDWNLSSVINLTKKAGLTNPKNCKPVLGRIEVCNSKYGNTGWLGIAQIWVNQGHITQATSKMNDTYFNTAKYNTKAWRQLVVCQEIAHGFGLDHQDEDFNNPNLGTCMDYTNTPGGPPSNEHPNAHDYEQLALIYGHLDNSLVSSSIIPSSINQGDGDDLSDPKNWGKGVRKDSRGRANLYERDFGGGKKIITHVIWIDSIEAR